MSIKNLLENNKQWAAATNESDPEFLAGLAKGQSPKYLWIGCSDSRVPASQVVGLGPGDMFVHRNIANQVKHTDINCQSVVQYAVDALKVEHIIVCGHYNCGGVQAALGQVNAGIVDYWLRSVKDSYLHKIESFKTLDEDTKLARMCEQNVADQVTNLAHSKIVQHAWQRGQKLEIHGLIYSLSDGLLEDLDVSYSGLDQVEEIYKIELGS